MASQQIINVKVAYESAKHHELITIELPENSTVEQAIKESGILQKCSEINLATFSLGIYGKIVDNNRILKNLDRVEIYRPLTIDPMHARRMRAELQ